MIKTFAAMLLSGAMGAGSAITYAYYAPAPMINLQPLVQQLQMMNETRRTDAAALAQLEQEWAVAAKSQQAVLLQIHQDMLRQEIAHNTERAEAQAAVEHYHGSLGRVIQSIPR